MQFARDSSIISVLIRFLAKNLAIVTYLPKKPPENYRLGTCVATPSTATRGTSET